MGKLFSFLDSNPMPKRIIQLLAAIVIAAVVAVILFRLSHVIIRKIAKTRKKQNNLNMRLLENAFKFLVLFLAFQWVLMSSELTQSFGRAVFQGTAVLAAIAAFAAQNILSDILCGMIISTTKPFEIGDRIELDNGVSGIVKDLTLRHVELLGIDTQRFVIPNSKINGMTVHNLSWHSEKRSVDFRFTVALTSDPDRAREVIRQAIVDSPLSVPGKPRRHGEGGEEYADVYFLSFMEYGLVMGTTAYYLSSTPTEVFKTDINTRVKKALEAGGIEIPLPYLNVQMKQ